MTKKHRGTHIPRPIGSLFQNCEYQLRCLARDIDCMAEDPEKYKDVATRLRLLVCESRSNRPIIFRAMNEIGVDYRVSHAWFTVPPGYFIFVDERESKVFDLWLKTLDKSSSAEDRESLEAEYRSLAVPIPLKDYIDNVLAFSAAGNKYSIGNMISILANKMGTAHVDESLPIGIHAIMSVECGGVPAITRTLVAVGHMVIDAGREILGVAASRGLYESRALEEIRCRTQEKVLPVGREFGDAVQELFHLTNGLDEIPGPLQFTFMFRV
jgi:hypothetical protein